MQTYRTWHRHPVARLSGWLVLLAFLVWLRLAMSVGCFRNSDDASNFLAGLEMAHGNWSLHGWIMAADSYWLTDVLLQAILSLILGIHPILMQAAEAAIWGAIGCLGTWLAVRDAPRGAWPGIAATSLCLLACTMFVHDFSDSFLTTIASHGSTILLTLIAFALHSGGGSARRNPRLLALLAIVTVGSVSDPIFDIIACLPILASALLAITPGADWRRWLPPALTVAGGVALGRLLLGLTAGAGGFSTIGLSVTLAGWPQVQANLGFAIDAIARLLGAGFTGQVMTPSLAQGPLIELLRLGFLVGFVLAIPMAGAQLLRALATWPTGDAATSSDELDRLLLLSLLLCVASVVLTTIITDPTCARFLLPATVTGGILTARRIGRLRLPGLYAMAMLPLSLFACLASVPSIPMRGNIAVPPETALVATLAAHGLHHGYAGFWEANMTTALSKRDIVSLPLLGGGADRPLRPMRWFDNMDWFAAAAHDWTGPVFFVVSQQPSGLELSADQVTRAFGPPSQTLTLTLYSVLIYDLPTSRRAMLTP